MPSKLEQKLIQQTGKGLLDLALIPKLNLLDTLFAIVQDNEALEDLPAPGPNRLQIVLVLSYRAGDAEEETAAVVVRGPDGAVIGGLGSGGGGGTPGSGGSGANITTVATFDEADQQKQAGKKENFLIDYDSILEAPSLNVWDGADFWVIPAKKRTTIQI